MRDDNKYFIYARKSTESDERQTQSIDDQLKVMKEKSIKIWLNIVDVITESMSAKAPWRYRFNEMISRIEKWEANWIISWKLDRISRNPVDSWAIQYMLQNWKLNRVITNDREYNPVDAWLLMSVENGMSNQFLLDLSKNVKRGIQSKAEKGRYPWCPPIWYLNDLSTKTIIKHPEQFEIVKKIWKYMITWNYSANDILKKVNNEWLLKTRRWIKLSKSWIYWILNNVFYTGDFNWKWDIMNWKHPVMITYEEFNRVQDILWKKWKAKLVKHNFSYTWIVRCWSCWSMVTAGNKHKYIKSTNSIKTYSYYWCTRKVKSIKQDCKQKAISSSELEKQIDDYLWCLEILPEFKEWALDIIKKDYHNDIKERENSLNKIQDELNKNRNKLDKLTDMLLEWRITDNIFDFKKWNLELEIKELNNSLLNIDNNRKEKIESIENMFNFVTTAREAFINWDYQTKKNIFRSLGLQFELVDWKMTIGLHPCLEVIKKSRYIITSRKYRFAPLKNSTSYTKTNTISSSIPIWQGL